MNRTFEKSGRIQLDQSTPPQKYNMSSSNKRTLKCNNIKNISSNLLNENYFSLKNMEIIQNNIRYDVWNKTNKKYIIAQQSEIQLEIIMRSIYLQYSKNLPNNIKEQIEELNNLVVDESVPKIISNIQQYIGYKKDLENGPSFMDHPKNVSSAGSKSLINNLF